MKSKLTLLLMSFDDDCYYLQVAESDSASNCEGANTDNASYDCPCQCE